MNSIYKPNYDESKDIEIIFDFHNSQIWRINSTNADRLIDTGLEFDKGIDARLDERGRCRLIYVIDQMPPLTAVLKHIENPFKANWAVIAVLTDRKSNLMEKVSPIISYGLSITKLKNKFVIGVFDHKTNRDDLTEVIKWQDSNMEIKPSDKAINWVNSSGS